MFDSWPLISELLGSLAEWIAQSPIAALLGIGAAPLLLIAARGWSRARAAQRDAAPAAPAEGSAEPAPAAALLRPAAPPAPIPAQPAPSAPEPAPAALVEALVVEPAIVEAAAPAAAPARLGERLRRTREGFIGRLLSRIGGRTLDAELLAELEALLFSADLGVRTAEALLSELKARAGGGSASQVRAALRDAILARLRRVEPEPAPTAFESRPHVILVLGVNGSGKTTTIGKLAARYATAGQQVLLGAGDTFRAAAGEQLQIWGERVGCEVIRGPDGGDPAAVAFDTVKAARARGADVALIDTAGRLQTKKPLMEELGKIARVIGRELPGAPHETLLVLDANTGQNAISQARLFSEVTKLTGLVLTKLDGTAKGGVIVGLAEEFGIPVRYVGVGESLEDLRDFVAADFVEALFEE